MIDNAACINVFQVTGKEIVFGVDVGRYIFLYIENLFFFFKILRRNSCSISVKFSTFVGATKRMKSLFLGDVDVPFEGMRSKSLGKLQQIL